MIRRLMFALQVLTLGKQHQSFLGAKWVINLLRLGPDRYKRQLALTVLSWSPHYFYRKPEYLQLSHFEFTEKEFERNKSSREKICSYILSPYLNKSQVVLDYGCGPGFLANSVSRHVRKVYGVDLSEGVLQCARILNGLPNINFLHTTQLCDIEDLSIDLVYSFAVIQHVTDSAFREILSKMRTKLRSGGLLIIHVVLDDDNWRTEPDWRGDTSLKGRLRWHAMNCFGRNMNDVRGMLETAGYTSIVIKKMSELCHENFDDVCTQHLIQAVA